MNLDGDTFVVRAPYEFMPFGYEIKYGIRQPGGSILVAQPVTMIKVEPERSSPSEPMLTNVSYGAMQILMDRMWTAGIRPSDIGTPGHLSATQAHLKDMQKIVSKQLKIQL